MISPYLPSLLLTFASLGLSSTGFSQVTPVSPFVGDRSEGFENTGNLGFQACIINRVFGGTADLCTTDGSSFLSVSPGWSLDCSVSPHTGTRFTASAGPAVRISFDSDIDTFGGYMTSKVVTLGAPESIDIRFYNRQGALIATMPINTTGCNWTWNGWSAPGTASIEIQNNNPSTPQGGFVDLDSLQVSGGGEGVPMCDPMNPNSTGQSTRTTGFMTSPVGSGLHLESSQGPPNQFGYYLIGTGASDPGLPIGQGRLCLATTGGNQFGRYNLVGTVRNSVGRFDSSGLLQNLVGTSSVGTGFDVPSLVPTIGGNIGAGQTWHFQLWHRETGGNSNFSNGLSITF